MLIMDKEVLPRNPSSFTPHPRPSVPDNLTFILRHSVSKKWFSIADLFYHTQRVQYFVRGCSEQAV